jgi:hypothetical protein
MLGLAYIQALHHHFTTLLLLTCVIATMSRPKTLSRAHLHGAARQRARYAQQCRAHRLEADHRLPVTSSAQAIEKLDWYAQRWKIETFHKISKSGCHAEDTRFRTAQRHRNLLRWL